MNLCSIYIKTKSCPRKEKKKDFFYDEAPTKTE